MIILTSADIEQNNQSLVLSSMVGNIENVKRLIPISDPKSGSAWALMAAAENGHTEIVKLLIPLSKPWDEDYGMSPLARAAWNGHTECVKILLPVFDPKAEDSQALRVATRRKHIECIKCLIPVSDYHLVLNTFSGRNIHQSVELLKTLVQEYEATQQKERLTTNIQSVANKQQNASPVKRKM